MITNGPIDVLFEGNTPCAVNRVVVSLPYGCRNVL